MSTHGRYAMLRKIADGGMAEIFLARQSGEEGFSRLVIVKRILPAYSNDPHFRDMLLDEGHIAMTLNHSNVVPVLDLGRAEGSYFLVMELVDGWDLQQVYDRGARVSFHLPLGLALYIVAEALRGLHYAHSRRDSEGKLLGIIHRDMSPQNVLISEQGEVKVTDFGIAKALGRRDRTQTGMIKGKLDFMSPEQASSAPMDAASDIFAAGTVLYLLTTGRRPFAGMSDMESLMRIQRADFAPPDEVRPGLSPGVSNIIRRAMAKRPTDRYRSAEEMMLDIESVLREEFASPGQSQLKAWLGELSVRDGEQALSQRPGLEQVAPSLTSRWFAEGEMLSFDDSSQVRLGTFSQPAPMPEARAMPAVRPVSFSRPAAMARPIPGSMGPMNPMMPSAPRMTAPPSMAMRPGRGYPFMRRTSGGMRTGAYGGSDSMLDELPRSGSFLKGVVLLLLLVGAGALVASQVLPKERQKELLADASSVWRFGVTKATELVARVRTPAVREAVADDPNANGPNDDAAKAGKLGVAAERGPGLSREARREARQRREAEERERAEASQSAERVTITLQTQPAQAKVIGPKGPLGTTPLPFTLRVGSSERLTFYKEGFETESRTITGDKKDGAITIALTPRKAPK